MKKPNGKDCLLIEGLCSCGACHDKTEVPADGGEAFRKWRGNVFTTDPPNTPRPETKSDEREQRLELQAALGTGAWMRKSEAWHRYRQAERSPARVRDLCTQQTREGLRL